VVAADAIAGVERVFVARPNILSAPLPPTSVFFTAELVRVSLRGVPVRFSTLTSATPSRGTVPTLWTKPAGREAVTAYSKPVKVAVSMPEPPRLWKPFGLLLRKNVYPGRPPRRISATWNGSEATTEDA
jgi:hypothetical protein